MTRYRLLVVQTEPRFGEVAANVATALRAAERRLSSQGADLVVLPELFATGYAFVSRREALALAEDPRHGATARAVREFARDHRLHEVP